MTKRSAPKNDPNSEKTPKTENNVPMLKLDMEKCVALSETLRNEPLISETHPPLDRKYLERLVEVLIPPESAYQVTPEEYLGILSAVQPIFMQEPNVIRVKTPVSICGDIHGQFRDLQRLFEAGGSSPETHYVFLGDLVDRGANSVNTVSLLMALKVLYPERMTILRGNHECVELTCMYGFDKECRRRFNKNMYYWKMTMQVFIYMPIVAIVDEKIFCVHGGISPSITSIAQIEAMDRTAYGKTTIVNDGFSDLLWSDPNRTDEGFDENERGIGKLYGKKALQTFLSDNNLTMLVRAHELISEGYHYEHDHKMVTVWSAPDYCGEGSKACIMQVDQDHNHNFVFFKKSEYEPKSDDEKEVYGSMCFFSESEKDGSSDEEKEDSDEEDTISDDEDSDEEDTISDDEDSEEEDTISDEEDEDDSDEDVDVDSDTESC